MTQGRAFQRIHYERRGPVALVTIDRPERHNAVDGETAAALLAAFERFSSEDAAVMVLTGAGGARSAPALT